VAVEAVHGRQAQQLVRLHAGDREQGLVDLELRVLPEAGQGARELQRLERRHDPVPQHEAVLRRGREGGAGERADGDGGEHDDGGPGQPAPQHPLASFDLHALDGAVPPAQPDQGERREPYASNPGVERLFRAEQDAGQIQQTGSDEQ